MMNRLVPYPLWIGNAGDGRNVRQILETEIQAVVQVAGEEPSLLLPRDLIYCRFPLLDGSENRPEILRLAIHSLEALLKAHIPTLVCCSQGMSRSPALAAAALSLLEATPPDDCLKLISRIRRIDVSPGFWKQVLTLLENADITEKTVAST